MLLMAFLCLLSTWVPIGFFFPVEIFNQLNRNSFIVLSDDDKNNQCFFVRHSEINYNFHILLMAMQME